MIYLAWKVLGTLSHFCWWERHTSQNVFISRFFALSYGTSTNPYFTLRRAFLLFYAIFFEFESPSSFIKAPTRRQYDRTWVLDIANMRVCLMNGSMVEHDGLGITYLALIFWKTWLLVDMLEYLSYHVNTRLLLWKI